MRLIGTIFSHESIPDLVYDLAVIRDYLTSDRLTISNVDVQGRCIWFDANTSQGKCSVSLINCNVHSFFDPQEKYNCQLDIRLSKENRPCYLLISDDNRIVVECSLICVNTTMLSTY